MTPDVRNHGFLHNGRLVFALEYRMTDGSTVIPNQDRDRNCLEATRTGKPGKRIVTTLPGVCLVCIDGTRGEVSSVRVRIESRPLSDEELARRRTRTGVQV
jgi:hypothetical protein